MTKDTLELRLSLQNDTLRVEVANRGLDPAALWERNNSWGWSMFSVLVAPARSGEWQELTAQPTRQTRNVPRARRIPPHETITYELRPGDPSWVAAEPIGEEEEGSLRVRVKLHVEPTAEATEQNVFVGEAVSNVVESIPPHRWLGGG